MIFKVMLLFSVKKLHFAINYQNWLRYLALLSDILQQLIMTSSLWRQYKKCFMGFVASHCIMEEKRTYSSMYEISTYCCKHFVFGLEE